MRWRCASAVAAIMGLAACAPGAGASPSPGVATPLVASATPSTTVGSSLRPIPSQDAAAIAKVDAGCVAYDRELVARGRTATISVGYAVETAAEQQGRWVLLYGDGTRFVTCAQHWTQPQSGMAEFRLSDPEPWAVEGAGSPLRSCTNEPQAALFYCVGRVEPEAIEVVVYNAPDATVHAVPGAGGRFVVSFPYVGVIRREGRLGDRVQVGFFDACGYEFHPIRMAGTTPCPRPT